MRVHRSVKLALIAGLALGVVATPRPAAADNEPVIVVPGRAGVPVMMNGVDVSGAVIEGEWGLNRPGVVAPTVIMPYWRVWAPSDEQDVGPYFPTTGHRPRYGRHEIIPPANRRKPRPAERYFREWHSESEPSPATSPAPFFNPPPVIVAPRLVRPRPAPPRPHPVPPHTP
jgi:hypothetical protein